MTVHFGTDYSYFESDGIFAYWSSERRANNGDVVSRKLEERGGPEALMQTWPSQPNYPSNTSLSAGDDLYIQCSYE